VARITDVITKSTPLDPAVTLMVLYLHSAAIGVIKNVTMKRLTESPMQFIDIGSWLWRLDAAKNRAPPTKTVLHQSVDLCCAVCCLRCVTWNAVSASSSGAAKSNARRANSSPTDTSATRCRIVKLLPRAPHMNHGVQ